MKNYAIYCGLIIAIIIQSGCQAIQPVLILRPGDFITFGFFYLLLSFVFTIFLFDGKTTRNFWLWFIGNIILTPIFGIIMLIKKLK